MSKQYDENGCSSTLNDIVSHEAIGKNKKGGLATISNNNSNGKDYFNTEKITIIAQSGCGKTQLAFDLAYFVIGPYKHIVYINTHFDDKIVVNFKNWCKKAGIGFFEVEGGSSATKTLEIPDVDHCLYIIDDTYTSTGRTSKKEGLALELLIKRLWNKGRWDGNHVIYIAHLDAFLPHEAIKNATQLWVDRPYEKFPVSSKIPEIGKKWYMIKNALDEKYGQIYEPEITTPFHVQQIVTRLKLKKNKLPKDEYPLATEKENLEIGLQGNEKVLKEGMGVKASTNLSFTFDDFF